MLEDLSVYWVLTFNSFVADCHWIFLGFVIASPLQQANKRKINSVVVLKPFRVFPIRKPMDGIAYLKRSLAREIPI
jgi:hypothetical protein